jgi:hypothetical protein
MNTSEFETRIKRVEGRLDKAEVVLGTVGRVVEAVERAQARGGHTKKGLRSAAAIFVGSAVVALALVLMAREHSPYSP